MWTICIVRVCFLIRRWKSTGLYLINAPSTVPDDFPKLCGPHVRIGPWYRIRAANKRRSSSHYSLLSHKYRVLDRDYTGRPMSSLIWTSSLASLLILKKEKKKKRSQKWHVWLRLKVWGNKSDLFCHLSKLNCTAQKNWGQICFAWQVPGKPLLNWIIMPLKKNKIIKTPKSKSLSRAL